MILVGAGGCAIDTITFFNAKNIVLFDDYKTGSIEHCPILGTIDDLIRLKPDDDIYNCIGSVGWNDTRNKIYEKLKAAGIKTKPLLLCSFLSKNVQVGNNSLLNIGSQIHHDVVIEDNVVIGPGVIVCGNVHICQNAFIGVGSTIIQGLKIGKNSIIGAGSVVLKNIGDNEMWYGNPARFVKRLE